MKKAVFELTFQFVGAVLLLIAIVVGSGAQQVNPISNETDQFVFNVVVYDRLGAPVMGLHEEDFLLLIDKKPAKIDFFSGRDAPESVCLLVDTSASMPNRDSWEAAVGQLRRFVLLSNPGSQFLLITVSDTPRLVADWSSDRSTLATAIASLEHGERKGSGALADACVLAINKAAQAKNQKKFILLIAGGANGSSKTPRNQFRRLLEDSNIPVYCVAMTDPVYDLNAGQDRVFLEDIATQTGGLISFPGSRRETGHLVEQFALLMRHGYQIGFNRASLPRDGRRHKLTVKVKTSTKESEKYFVHAAEGVRANN